MAAPPILSSVENYNQFMRSVIGVEVTGQNTPGFPYPILGNPQNLGGPTPLTGKDACWNNIYNFFRPSLYAVADAVTQMGTTSFTPFHNLLAVINNSSNPQRLCDDFNTFYKVIFTPYTRGTLNATPANFEDRIKMCIIGPLMVPINGGDAPRKVCGPLIVVCGGEAVNSYTAYKYNSLRTNDMDTKVIHRPYWNGQRMETFGFMNNMVEDFFRQTGNPNVPDINPDPQFNNSISLDERGCARRLFLFRSLVFFLLQKITRKFNDTQVPNNGNPGLFAQEYQINNQQTRCRATGIRAQLGYGNQIVDFDAVFRGREQAATVNLTAANRTALTAALVTLGMKRVMQLSVVYEFNGENLREIMVDCAINCKNWLYDTTLTPNTRIGNDLGVFKIMDPHYNGMLNSIWSSGIPNEKFQDLPNRPKYNYNYTFLNLAPTLLKQGTPVPGVVAAAPFPGFGMSQDMITFLTSEKKICIVPLGYLIFDQTRMCLVGYHMAQPAPVNQNANPRKLTKYKQKLTAVLGTLNINNINQYVYDVCQGYRIPSNNVNPVPKAYWGGAVGNTESQVEDLMQDESQVKDLMQDKSQVEDLMQDKSNTQQQINDKFDDLTDDEKKSAMKYSMSLIDKENEIGEEKMQEFLSKINFNDDIEFYGYLNFLALSNPDLSDYRLGLLGSDQDNASLEEELPTNGGKNIRRRKTIKLNRKKGKKNTRRLKY